MKPLYLDDAASTQVKKEVVRAMLPYFTQEYGNPSSPHTLGENARGAIDKAREVIAKKINARAYEIIFTSGVTEANNLVLFGLAGAQKKKKIIISAIEHASINEPCRYLSGKGYEIVKIPVGDDGLIKFDLLEKAIDEDTFLVSVMHANNVIGVIQDIEKIGALCRKKRVLFHTDAAQSFGTIEIDVRSMNLELLSASAHKIGGPKGIGFIYVRDGIKIEPIIFGGSQERGLRGGTENVPAIVGFAKAAELCKSKNFVINMRDRFMKELEEIGGVINGSRTRRLPTNVHVSFKGIDANILMAFLSRNNIYVATGSACETKREDEEPALKAIRLSKELARGSIRMTLPDKFSSSDMKRVLKELSNALKILHINK